MHLIGSGGWMSSNLSKRLSVDVQGLRLWRLRIDKGGRILFKVTKGGERRLKREVVLGLT